MFIFLALGMQQKTQLLCQKKKISFGVQRIGNTYVP